MSNEPMTPEKAVERVISLLQSCKGSDGCLGYIERYIYEEDEQAIDVAIQLLKEGEVYMTAEDFNLYMEGYKQGRKDFERPQGKWIIAFHDCTGEYYLCSSCKEGRAVINEEDYASLDEFKFCPNCGADMRGEKNDT